ncbi:MAG: 30S ribosomal protein S6 [Acidobacteria bacterium]|nr:30S ribosomal protein S6 [Acidobacteriota bacterium]
MRTYEIMFILKPDLPEEEVDRFISSMETLVTSTGGTIRKVEKMGRRHMGYSIRRYREGQYALFVTDCEFSTIQEFERRLKVADSVIKFLTVRTDEEIKKAEKMQKIRAKRTARRKSAAPSAEAATS